MTNGSGGAGVGSAEAAVVTRTFDAALELVWKAWTEPEQVMRWWGPKDFTSPACNIDFRVGGKYLFCMRSLDGQDIWSTGTYREIVLMQRIVYTDSFADEHGNVVSGSHYGMDGLPMEFTVTLAFEERDGRTTMTLWHEGLPEGEMREMTAVGWNESFDKLDQSLH